MKLSIITPVFNDRRVGGAIESALAQQHAHELELVVVDAGSTDGTLELLTQYREQISVLVSEPDQGIFHGMNKGIAHATGEVVGILNADDRYSDPLVLRDVADAFGADASVDACYGDMVYINEAGRIVRYWKAGCARRAKWRFGWMPPHPTFFVRRQIYQRHGVFDLSYPIAADYELMLRLIRKHQINLAYLNRVVMNMAPGGNSTRTVMRILQANMEVARACRSHGMRDMLLAPALKPARKVFQLVNRP